MDKEQIKRTLKVALPAVVGIAKIALAIVDVKLQKAKQDEELTTKVRDILKSEQKEV